MICTTIENVSHVRFEWTVEDFYPQMYECGDMIQSEEFPPYDLQKEFWTLRLYPKGYQRSNEDDSTTTPLYLTLCPSHISSSNQMQIYFRALINFSNPQGRILHTETIQNCGGNITDEIILMKMTNSICEEFYKEPIDHLIISIELVSIDDIAKRSMKTSTTKIIDGSSRVVSKVMKMKLRWKIEKFSILVNESSSNSFIESCEFTFNKQRNHTNVTNLPDDENEEQLINGTKSTNDIPSHQWSLILYPNGKTERFKGSLSIFLEHTFGANVRVVIRFSLIDGRGRKINTKQLPSHVLAIGERWGVGDFLKHSMILQNQQELISENQLRIYCQIKILERQTIDEKKFLSRPLIRTKTNRTTTTINDDPETYWPSLFYSAYLDKKMFDMYLKCGNEIYNVHKLILALRSSVLAKMIKEKEGGRSSPTKTTRSQPTDDSSFLTIEINDIDQKTIPYFLEYLYTGGIKKLAVPGAIISHTLVIDLLTIANNYDIPDLKTYAEYYLKDIIRVDNACELLVLSDTIKSETLKQTTCDFIANNLGNIMETTGWSELKAKQSDLIDIILKSCLLLRK
jgi:hypothetical protein